MLWVEWVRDSLHVLSHKLPWLARHHNIHHRVFNRDMSPVSLELYQYSQWHHDIPEAVVMSVSAFLFLLFVDLRTHSIGGLLGSSIEGASIQRIGCLFLSVEVSDALGRSTPMKIISLQHL